MTDRPRFDPGFQFKTLLIEPSQLKSWTQTPGGTYYHRLKIHALRMALDHFKSKVALVDTDTYFVGRPQQLLERISPESTVMHALERRSIGSESEFEPLFVAPRRKLQISGIEVSRRTGMYNSGVIGVDATHAPLLEAALVVLDDLYARAPVFNIEQFAVTAVLGAKTRLSACNDLVVHYWGFARGFIHEQIAEFFPTATPAEFAQRLAGAQMPLLGEPKVRFFDRLSARARGTIHGWQDGYRYAYLAQRAAFSSGALDARIANIWARVALKALKMQRTGDSMPKSENVLRDFGRFAGAASNAAEWLDPEVRREWQRELAG